MADEFKRTNDFYLIRTYSAGVHVGKIVDKQGTYVKLTETYRIWRWSDAFTLTNVGKRGIGEDSRIAGPGMDIELTEAVEIAEISDVALQSIIGRAE